MKKLLTTAAILATLGIGSGAMAASQGTAGTTSTGTVDLSVTSENVVQISNLQDIGMTWNGVTQETGSTPACIHSSSSGHGFKLTASSTNTFNVSNGVTSYPYTVKLKDDIGAEVASLAHGVEMADESLGSGAADCGGGNNYQIEVTLPQLATGDIVDAGMYTDTMTLLVNPA